uniref:RING-type domain-containing protein n=1 Tax=Macrostomum lignano TaxID=282301 RepID=A0A1I8JN47_9PLAT
HCQAELEDAARLQTEAPANQASSLQRFKAFILTCCGRPHVRPDESRGPFVIADFGCSTGLNSSGRGVPSHRETAASFLKPLPEMFADDLWVSFYEQVLPPSSLQIGISNICLHWCSQLPTKLSNHGYSLSGHRGRSRRRSGSRAPETGAASSGEVQGARQEAALLSRTSFHRKTRPQHLRRDLQVGRGASFARRHRVGGAPRTSNCPICFRSVEDVSEPSQYERLGLELLRAEGRCRRAARLTTRTSCSTETWTGSSLSTRQGGAVCAELWVEHASSAFGRSRGLFEFTWRTTVSLCGSASARSSSRPSRLYCDGSFKSPTVRKHIGNFEVRELLRVDDAAIEQNSGSLVDGISRTPPLTSSLDLAWRKLPQSLAAFCLNASCSSSKLNPEVTANTPGAAASGRTAGLRSGSRTGRSTDCGGMSLSTTSTELQLWLLAYLARTSRIRWDTASEAVESGAAGEVGDHEGPRDSVRSEVWAATAASMKGLKRCRDWLELAVLV